MEVFFKDICTWYVLEIPLLIPGAKLGCCAKVVSLVRWKVLKEKSKRALFTGRDFKEQCCHAEVALLRQQRGG